MRVASREMRFARQVSRVADTHLEFFVCKLCPDIQDKSRAFGLSQRSPVIFWLDYSFIRMLYGELDQWRT